GALCPSDTVDHGKSQRCRLDHVISCVQSQLTTSREERRAGNQFSTERTCTQCALMISVAPAVPCVSAHQCHINATYQCLPVHINTTYQCPSELPFGVTHQCHL
ncbi:unnamed protein product, partial [Staurois parvus]